MADIGRVGDADQALAVPAEPVARLGPTGFDPSRVSMLERIARAMFWHEWRHCSSIPWEEFETSFDYWDDAAKAALEAMREPTNAMLQGACGGHKAGEPMNPPGATYKEGRYKFPLSSDECPRFRNRRKAWQQMIDAALATEAGTAETTEIGSVHEGAGPKDNAQGTPQ